MRLNAQTDYSLRIMMYLATKESATATIPEVASKLELSKNHTMRIVAKLAKTGLIASTRGRSGGLALGRQASQITVVDVVIAIEPDFALVHCLQAGGGPDCTIERACLLKGVLLSALKAFLAELRAVTLADLTQPNVVRLNEIFQLGATTRPTLQNHLSTTRKTK